MDGHVERAHVERILTRAMQTHQDAMEHVVEDLLCAWRQHQQDVTQSVLEDFEVWDIPSQPDTAARSQPDTAARVVSFKPPDAPRLEDLTWSAKERVRKSKSSEVFREGTSLDGVTAHASLTRTVGRPSVASLFGLGTDNTLNQGSLSAGTTEQFALCGALFPNDTQCRSEQAAHEDGGVEESSTRGVSAAQHRDTRRVLQ